MKRDKLYTANKWNSPMLSGKKNLFPFGGLAEQYALRRFDDMQSPWYNQTAPQFTPYGLYISRDTADTPFSAVPYSNTVLSNAQMDGRNPYGSTLADSSIGQTPTTIMNTALSNWGQYKDTWKNASSNPANQSASKGFDWGKAGNIAAGVGASVAAIPMFNDPYKEDKKTDFYDMADPTYHLAGGRESAVGNTFGTVGKGLFQAGASTGNPWLMAAGAGAKIIGGLTNAAFGVKWNDKNIKTVENNIAGMRQAGQGFNRLSTNSDLANAMSNTNMGFNFSNSYIGKDGWFNSKATKKANKLRAEQGAAQAFAKHAFADAASQLDTRNDDMAQLNTAAYGGFLDNLTNNNGMDAINYGFLSDYLMTKDKQNAAKDKMAMGNLPLTMFAKGGKIKIKHPGRLTELKKRTGKTEAELWAEGKPEVRKMITFARNARKWQKAYGGFLDAQKNLFALGGDTQMHGADYSTGLLHVDAGGTHEENPNEGVQLGVDNEGTPNMVEEGETVYNDYVFSNRIGIDDATKAKFHIGKKRKMSFADLSKKLEREIEERPNDPISKAALKKQLEKLQEEQERQKQEMQAREAREAFESLSPEEQVAVIQQLQAQQQGQEQAMQEQAMQQQGLEQAAQQQAMQEQMMAQQGYGSPEEEAMMQQQMMAQQGAPMMQEEYACGGKINRFDLGGDLKKAIWASIGVHTQDEWDKWAKEHNVTLGDDFKWENALNNDSLKSALGANSPSLQHVLGAGYDYGVFKPTASTGEINFLDSEGKSYMNVGNWAGANDKQPSKTWNESGDRMYKEAIELLKQRNPDNWQSVWDNLDRKGLEDLFKETQAYKDTTAWMTDKEHGVDNMLAYLNALSKDPGFNTPSAIKHLERFVDRNTGKWKEGVDTSDVNALYSQIFGEQSGNAGRVFYPGNYWHTPSILNNPRGAKTLNYVVNDDGSVSLIETDVPKEWKLGSTYSWQNPTEDLTYNYYTRPDYKGTAFGAIASGAAASEKAGAKGGANPVDANGNHKWLPKPVLRDERWRYLGLAGPAIGLGLWGAGVGRPDTSGYDAALARMDKLALADWVPIHERLKYQPYDVWSQQNRQNATSAATNRYLTNNSGSLGQKAAGLLANEYQNRLASGALGIQAQQYNDQLNQAVQKFNQSTSLANQAAYDQTSQFNANAMNQHRNILAQMSMDAATRKAAIDRDWYNGLYGNISGLFKGLGDLGRENAQRNMLARMAANGIFGPMSPSTYVSDGFINWYQNPDYKDNSAACGGKISKKKNKRRGGLTY